MVAVDDVESGLEKEAVIGDDDLPPAVVAKRRIRYFDDDEVQNAAGPSGNDLGPPLRRHDSTFSVHSFSSVRSGQRVVDPTLALPVQYRTLSYTIANTSDKALDKARDAREKTAIGMCPYTCLYRSC